MNVRASTIWGLHLNMAYRALLRDVQAQIGLLVLAGVAVGVGLWSAGNLAARVTSWEAAGAEVLTLRLWLLCAGAWAGVSFFALLGTVHKGMSDEGALLLLTLPLTPATRFRALFGLLFVEHLGSLVLLTGIALGAALGSTAVPWLALLLVGLALSVALTMIGTLFVIRYLLAHRGRLLGGGVALALALSGLGAVALMMDASRLPSPSVAAVGLGAGLLLVLGPLAGRFGMLYLAACSTVQGWDRSRRARTLPGMGWASSLFERHRGVTGAMVSAGLLRRSRSPLTVPRFLMLPLYLAVFPWVQGRAAALGLEPWLVVSSSAAFLTLFLLLDSDPSPIGSEGERLKLYLLAPLSFAAILRAKAVSVAGPMLLFAAGVAVGLGAWAGLLLSALARALLATLLTLIAPLALVTWGSAWDEDLNQSVEGAAQTLIHEEAPLTPRRLALFNGVAMLLTLALLLLWKLPLMASLPGLGGVSAVVGWLSWRFAHRCLRALTH